LPLSLRASDRGRCVGHGRCGPFVFFDQMGPGEFMAARGLDVRPHPLIGLATVAYLSFLAEPVVVDPGWPRTAAGAMISWMPPRGVVAPLLLAPAVGGAVPSPAPGRRTATRRGQQGSERRKDSGAR
jgi:hypothetical protein